MIKTKPHKVQIYLSYVLMAIVILFFILSNNLKTSRIIQANDNLSNQIEYSILSTVNTLYNNDISSPENIINTTGDNNLKLQNKFLKANNTLKDSNLILKADNITKTQLQSKKRKNSTQYIYEGTLTLHSAKINDPNTKLTTLTKPILVNLESIDGNIFISDIVLK